MKRALVTVLFLSSVSCRETSVNPDQHRSEIEKWQKVRATRLMAEDGWLSLVALQWLNEGANNVEGLGTIVLQNGKTTLGSQELKHDAEEGGPTVLTRGSKRFNVIKRADRYGVRIKDSQSPARVNFKGLEYFPVDPRWRVEAKLVPHNPPKTIPITNIVGQTTQEKSPGALEFELNGKTYRLDPILEEGSTDYFVIFKDETSRRETYPAGRYLYASPAGADGKVILDFNKAYNPPCVFTPFATCPLPPRQNVLPVRIEAGEKNYEKGGEKAEG